MDIWLVLIGWGLFAGTHYGLSAIPVRKSLINKLGKKGFEGVYSLVALVTFGLLIYFYVITKSTGDLFLAVGMRNSVVVHLSELLMIFAFVLLIGGFLNKTPMGMGKIQPEARGIVRITRHPMNMAFLLFGVSHLLTNRFIGDWIFYGGFILYGYLGSWHQDRKKIDSVGLEMKKFIDSTAIFPFVAIISGKQKMQKGEIRKLGVLAAVIVAIIVRILHPSILAQL